MLRSSLLPNALCCRDAAICNALKVGCVDSPLSSARCDQDQVNGLSAKSTAGDGPHRSYYIMLICSVYYKYTTISAIRTFLVKFPENFKRIDNAPKLDIRDSALARCEQDSNGERLSSGPEVSGD